LDDSEGLVGDIQMCLVVTGGGSVGKCGRLSRPSWLFSAL